MDPKYLVAKLEAHKCAVEMNLWRELQNDMPLTSPWTIAYLVGFLIGLVVLGFALGDIPRASELIMLFFVMLFAVQMAAAQKRLAVITKLMKMHLMNPGVNN